MTVAEELVLAQAKSVAAFYRAFLPENVPAAVVGLVRAVEMLNQPRSDNYEMEVARQWLNGGDTKFDPDAPLSVIAAHIMGELKAARAACRKEK